jgi:hypothetical protein
VLQFSPYPLILEAYMNICVFCGSVDEVPLLYKTAAEELGQHIAKRGHTLVFGGGNVGLMGETARSAQGSGGKVVGIIPDYLRDRELRFDRADELIITDTLEERKRLMIDRSDAFVMLPGGFGTLEEFFQVLASVYRDGFHRPMAVFNTAGFFNRLFGFFDLLSHEGFVPKNWKDSFLKSEKAGDILDYLESHR